MKSVENCQTVPETLERTKDGRDVGLSYAPCSSNSVNRELGEDTANIRAASLVGVVERCAHVAYV